VLRAARAAPTDINSAEDVLDHLSFEESLILRRASGRLLAASG